MAYYRKTVKAHSHLRCKYKENSEGQGSINGTEMEVQKF